MNKTHIYIDANKGNNTETPILQHCHITCLFYKYLHTLKTQVAVCS